MGKKERSEMQKTQKGELKDFFFFFLFDINSCLKSARGETVRSWNAPFC